jgi:hypothetical protein
MYDQRAEGELMATWRVRLAALADEDEVRAMIAARCGWMEEQGMPSWRPSLDDLVSQCANPGHDVWVLLQDGQIVGRTTLQYQAGGPWWSEAEHAGAFFMSTTVTAPALRHLKPGTLLAWWALDHAARHGAQWVRRDTIWPELAAYYQRQGYALARTAPRKQHTLYLLERRAERLDWTQAVSPGTPALPRPGG